ncbi:MAG TPA: dienelactone hydrolase family protein [Chloroflexota bacterium]|nr:dienelactone hydrolase family protein [Chloroflexota bacterium]
MCFDDDSHPPISLSANSSARGEALRITAADGTRVAAYMATPGEGARSQVVILPDARGLHHFYRELALRFADVGIRALAFDYFARSAEDDDRSEPFDYRSHIQLMTPDTFAQDLTAAVDRIRQGDGSSLPTFTVGFCMGGSLSLWAGTRGLNLAGVIAFYASLSRSFGAVTPALEWAPRITSPVLGLFGGADQGIPRSEVDQLEDELEEARIPHEIIVYPDAPHSFFDRKAAEFATESADAWARVQGFIGRYEPVRV